MPRRRIGYVAADGGNVKNYGEKKIVGYTDDAEGARLRAQCADANNL